VTDLEKKFEAKNKVEKGKLNNLFKETFAKLYSLS